MPPAINVEERLDAIAIATLEIAREHGAAGVTIRAVAARLGGATSRITKYVPTRAALLDNASRYMAAHWSKDASDALDQQTGIDRLRALARWSLNTEGYDDAIRRLWIDALASRDAKDDPASRPRQQARDEHESIHELVTSVLPHGMEWLADTLFLAFRGYYLSTVEDPSRWPPERAASAIEQLLDVIQTPDATPADPRRRKTPKRHT
jgi:AcrR family transcriptional regulator